VTGYGETLIEHDTITLKVPGMSCAHCETAVKTEIATVVGVTTVDVDLEAKDVHVVGTGLDRADIVAAILEAGYEVTS
jgi:copper chaperone CopZ